jgi:hypothetical protein
MAHEAQGREGRLVEVGSGTTTNRHNSHTTHFTVATDLIWPIAIVAMRHSSDGMPRRHRTVKLVAMGER